MKSTSTYINRSALFLFLLMSVSNVSSLPLSKRQELPPQCNSEDGYFIPPNPVIGAEAANHCQLMGGTLADINNQNVAILSGMVNGCLGTNKNVRIQTWDTNTFGTNNLILFSGHQAGAGTVSTSGASDRHFTLCKSSESTAASAKTSGAMKGLPPLPVNDGLEQAADCEFFTFFYKND
jgi:hypothetical protein